MKRLVVPPHGLALVLLVTALCALSCSTTRGSSYSSSVGQEAAAAAAAKKRAEEKKNQTPPSHPSNPSTPSSPGWNSGPQYNNGGISYGTSNPVVDLIVDAARLATSGVIVVDGLPAGARLFVDGSFVVGNRVMLPAGLHYLRVESFGSMPWASSVELFMGQTQELSVSLTASPFSLGAVRASPELFDAAAPGPFGKVEISFTASGPGSADIEILDSSDRRVFQKTDVAISGAQTRVLWQGTDRRGAELSAGEYRIRVQAKSEGGSSAEAWGRLKLSTEHSMANYSSLAGGFSGAFYAPDARILAAGEGEFATGAFAILDPSDASAARLPVFAGFRFGFPGGRTEVSASAVSVSYPGYDVEVPMNWASAALSLKTSLYADETWAASLLLGGAYASYLVAEAAPSWDGMARFPGLTAGLVVESDSSLARAFCSLQAEVSTYYPGWTAADMEAEFVPGLFSWAYLRGGLELPIPDLLGGSGSAAFSVAARSSPFNEGLSFTLPLSVGAELHYFLPRSSRVISIYGSGEWASKTDFYFGAGLGFGMAL